MKRLYSFLLAILSLSLPLALNAAEESVLSEQPLRVTNTDSAQSHTTSDVVLEGEWGWYISRGYLHIFGDYISNYDFYTTGTLRLRLVAYKRPYDGYPQYGAWGLGGVKLAPLPPESYYYDLFFKRYYNHPPRGWRYVTLHLQEYTHYGWETVDYINYPQAVWFP